MSSHCSLPQKQVAKASHSPCFHRGTELARAVALATPLAAVTQPVCSHHLPATPAGLQEV